MERGARRQGVGVKEIGDRGIRGSLDLEDGTTLPPVVAPELQILVRQPESDALVRTEAEPESEV